MKKYIVVKNNYEGIHRYKDAPVEVDYLRQYHRHIFNIETKIEVYDEDRELEFMIVKHLIQQFISEKKKGGFYWIMDNLSCENVCSMIYKLIKDNYGETRYVSVRVYEDNENSAIVED